ncbi:uroporphyrin-III C-methyltransferase [Thozetella sp. PMI_491]|nr:uroporphyrin-III C-methyltransferase [Thozetella sp. PMI_491]
MAAASPAFHTSLLTSVDARGHIHLIIGATPLAAARASTSLAAGAKPILIAAPSSEELQHGVRAHIDAGALAHLARPFQDSDLTTLGRPEIDGVVDAVFVTSARDPQAQHISEACRRKRIPVNVVDAPALCSFSLLSVHADGPLQIGVTTNGSGCKLASRIRREIAAVLPDGLGSTCARLGAVRRRIREEDRRRLAPRDEAPKPESKEAPETNGTAPGNENHVEGHDDDEGTDDSVDQTAALNKLVTDADVDAAKTRRMRWLAQVCEYWPLKRLAAITDDDITTILDSYRGADTEATANGAPASVAPSPHAAGRIILAGSGPGHPDLLTRATYRAIQTADLVLADKLVPAGVLDLIPRRTPVVIARKFPGNADQAQEELLAQALAASREGKTVLRLKQGDPFVYGRGGEEMAFFRQHGLSERDGRVLVLPGVTSALSAPLFAGVPVTQRDVADQVLVCTGTGKKGKPPAPPGYRAARTVVFLMALHRIEGLVAELTTHAPEEEERARAEVEKGQNGDVSQSVPETPGSFSRRLWPLDTPCAVIERASCPDQRVIRTTLRCVVEAIQQEGSRPPGLLVVGNACEALYAPESGKSWVVENGFKGLDFGGMAADGLASVA